MVEQSTSTLESYYEDQVSNLQMAKSSGIQKEVIEKMFNLKEFQSIMKSHYELVEQKKKLEK
ncbi:hypothetical protein DDB_G0275043 [Dictyostelium discoideum AX4]|uniref:Uncharacterized protein n=1 Tax=Dictyostelium discoideum TaxID=44689 RepID=Q86I55_DICDI|nr:hypothetical protein DDB_G0275043 [Dictyostelium discoideum AX4]EAL69802.1 hypothetical protein DDB_G0275043 [Dictyostelium discoideum AX4]|eukprot:XP_643840.1 hypothetical protein DDB_G0275043 [Dictyostelium discoideum AX4]